MSDFFIGIISSISGAIIAYVFKENIENIIHLIFKNIYPKVGGKWKINSYRIDYGASIYDINEDDLIKFLCDQELTEDEIDRILTEKEIYEENSCFKDLDNDEIAEVFKESTIQVIAEIKQLANKLKGEINAFENGKNIQKIKVTGRITPTRIMILSAEEKTEGCHNFGTFLVKLSRDSRYMKGYQTYLCAGCEETTYSNVLLEKI